MREEISKAELGLKGLKELRSRGIGGLEIDGSGL